MREYGVGWTQFLTSKQLIAAEQTFLCNAVRMVYMGFVAGSKYCAKQTHLRIRGHAIFGAVRYAHHRIKLLNSTTSPCENILAVSLVALSTFNAGFNRISIPALYGIHVDGLLSLNKLFDGGESPLASNSFMHSLIRRFGSSYSIGWTLTGRRMLPTPTG